MKTFYDACQKTLDFARKRDTFGTIACLTEADRLRDDIIRDAKACLELQTVHHVETYFRSCVRGCMKLWLNDLPGSVFELVRNQGMFSSTVRRCVPASVWTKTVSGGSLPERWAEHQG